MMDNFSNPDQILTIMKKINLKFLGLKKED